MTRRALLRGVTIYPAAPGYVAQPRVVKKLGRAVGTSLLWSESTAAGHVVSGSSDLLRPMEGLEVRLARENPSWGYDRIVRALANLATPVADQTVGNILHRHGIPPALKREHATTWKDFNSRAPGGSRRHRLFHRGGCHAARASLTTSYSLSTWRVAGSSWPG